MINCQSIIIKLRYSSYSYSSEPLRRKKPQEYSLNNSKFVQPWNGFGFSINEFIYHCVTKTSSQESAKNLTLIDVHWPLIVLLYHYHFSGSYRSTKWTVRLSVIFWRGTHNSGFFWISLVWQIVCKNAFHYSNSWRMNTTKSNKNFISGLTVFDESTSNSKHSQQNLLNRK